MAKRKKPAVKNEDGFKFGGKTGEQVTIPKVSEKTYNMVMNAFGDAFFTGFDLNGTGPGGSLNSAATLWRNNRWYLISNFRNLLSESYIEHGILQTVVDVPVDDGFRGGVEIHTKELEPSEIEELVSWMDEEDDLSKLGQTSKWNRLFGGAGTVINVDQDPAKPLDLTKKITRLELYSADLWELFWNRQNIDSDPSLGLSGNYNAEINPDYFNFYGEKIHKSRVLKQVGIQAPSLIRPRMRGWGVSVVEVMINSINQYLKSNRLIFEILDEFKVDYFRIKGYANMLLDPNGQAALSKRLAHVNSQKNYNHAVAMDLNDEWQQKQLNFAGLAEVGNGIRMQIASDLRMPMSKVFGISATGLGSGQDDIENYNAMVESTIRQKNKYQIIEIIKIRCYLMFGFVPADLKVTFAPLRVLGAEQEENVKTQKFTRILQARQAGEITSEEFRDACNKSKLMDIQLDNSPGLLKELKKEKESEETAKSAPKAPKGQTASPTAKES